MNPPAKQSPAPVGSKTESSGIAGAANHPPARTINAPYPPRLITREVGPQSRIVRAARTRFGSLASWRTSASLINSILTDRKVSRRDSGLRSIQKFIVSAATRLGGRTPARPPPPTGRSGPALASAPEDRSTGSSRIPDVPRGSPPPPPPPPERQRRNWRPSRSKWRTLPAPPPCSRTASAHYR